MGGTPVQSSSKGPPPAAARPPREPRGLRARPPLPPRAYSPPLPHPSPQPEWAGGERRTLLNVPPSREGPAPLRPARQWPHTHTRPHTHPLTRRRPLARLQPGSAPLRPAPRRAREQMASSRRPAPCQLLPGTLLPPPPPRGGGQSASVGHGRRPPLRRRRAPPTAVGHIEAGGGGRSSVASSPLPRWRLVPVSPQFLPYELGSLALIREEQVMRFFASRETGAGGRVFLRQG